MKFVHTQTPDEGIAALSGAISKALNDGRKVLWFICGGSNIPTSKAVMDEVRESIDGPEFTKLTVAFTDERYGPIDHPDSNAKQLADSGFNADGVMTIFPLCGLSLEQTVISYDKAITAAIHDSESSDGLIIAQFGIGPDGHIAGILPHTPAVADLHMVSGYVATPFTRITVTPVVMRKIHAAYAFAFGESKREALGRLRDAQAPIADEPCQILKEIPEAVLYSDVI